MLLLSGVETRKRVGRNGLIVSGSSSSVIEHSPVIALPVLHSIHMLVTFHFCFNFPSKDRDFALIIWIPGRFSSQTIIIVLTFFFTRKFFKCWTILRKFFNTVKLSIVPPNFCTCLSTNVSTAFDMHWVLVYTF